MGRLSRRHQAALDELTEWWEDLCTRGIGSRAVLVQVPEGWGRSTLLDQLAATIEADDAPVTLLVRIDGKPLRELPGGAAAQVRMLAELLADAGRHHRVAKLAGVDSPAGAVQLGLGVGALFATPLATAAAMVLGTVVAGAAGKAWDDSPAGQDGVLARAAQSVASVSVKVPVVVLVDDIDALGRKLAVSLAENLVTRPDGQVLLVAVTAPAPPGPGSRTGLLKDLASRPWLSDRVQRADADPDMGSQSRTSLAAELCPRLPSGAVRRIGRRTSTFAEVFAVCSARRLTDAELVTDEAAAVAVVDSAIDATLAGRSVSVLAGIVAWAGGIVHTRQAQEALAVTGEQHHEADPSVMRTGALVRLTDPASPGLPVAIGALSAADRQQMAAALTAAALSIAADPDAGLVEQVVAAQAAYRVRDDLPDRGQLLAVQRVLAEGLEKLGDLDSAYEVAVTAMTGISPGRDHNERQKWSAAVLRLARRLPGRRHEPLVADMIAAAVAGGAGTGLEARLWAAIDLLAKPARRETALALAEQVAADLGARQDLGAEAASWRRLLAFHAGQHGYPALAQQLLAPEITAASQERQDAAQAILHAIGGPHADTRLQIIACQAELAMTPDSAGHDRLRLHHTLAVGYETLGDYRHALQHAAKELPLRDRLQGSSHSDTLDTRNYIGAWTGQSGDPAGALRIYREVLPDRIRVLGPDHPGTLSTRGNIALFTGVSGNRAGALRLYRELLPDMIRILGRGNPDTLTNRDNIALWTGECGDPAGALRLFRQLLPDRVRVNGPDHPDTLTTRHNIAAWTGQCGDPAGALALFRKLLPDRVRVLGPDHPDTLITRNNIATWTGKSGDPAAALRLAQDLLPDQIRALGPSHPDTLSSRNNIATWTGLSGDLAGALRLFKELLPDQARILGPGHPDTMITRTVIAGLSGQPNAAGQQT